MSVIADQNNESQILFIMDQPRLIEEQIQQSQHHSQHQIDNVLPEQNIPHQINVIPEQNIPPQIQNLVPQINIPAHKAYFKQINSQLKEEYVTDQANRVQYLRFFKDARLERNASNSTQIIQYLLEKTYIPFLDHITVPLIKLFIEEQLDFFITSRGAQVRNDKLVFSFAIMLKIMRRTPKAKLLCLFENQPYELVLKYQKYFTPYTFWNLDEVSELEPTDKNHKVISVIRKLSLLLWALLWIDPNQAIQPISNEINIRTFEYTFLKQDRSLFVVLLKEFTTCQTYGVIPALSSLYDILSYAIFTDCQFEKNLLQKVFTKLSPQIEKFLKRTTKTINGEEYETSEELEIGECFLHAHNEFYVSKYVHDEGMMEVIQTKASLQNNPMTEVYNFYENQFKNDDTQRPNFYS